MWQRRKRRWLGLLLLLPTLLLGIESAATFALFRCRMDRVARFSCCCQPADSPGIGNESVQPQPATIAQRGCCKVEQVQLVASETPTTATPTSAISLPAVVLHSGAYGALHTGLPQSLFLLSAGVPASPKPPLVLLTHVQRC